jgi:hypothetical protein
MSIKEIIQQLRVTMDNAKGQVSHFDSWLTQNEGICKAIDALKILDTQPVAQRPVDFDALHAAWLAVGADVAGLNWGNFVNKLTEQP